MAKEIHFYTNLCNEKQISDKDITDVLVDYVDTKNAIEDYPYGIVRTTQLSFLRYAWDFIDNGWKIFIHNSDWVTEVKEHMEIPGIKPEETKDIRIGNDISRLLISGTFGKLE